MKRRGFLWSLVTPLITAILSACARQPHVTEVAYVEVSLTGKCKNDEVILLANQSAARDNGIYVCKSGSWKRFQ